jgi:hypothetical protein
MKVQFRFVLSDSYFDEDFKLLDEELLLGEGWTQDSQARREIFFNANITEKLQLDDNVMIGDIFSEVEYITFDVLNDRWIYHLGKNPEY